MLVDTSAHVGRKTSSERFKEAIKPMDKASEAILALQPVTFRYKHELDPDGIPQFGLVAEQVEQVNADLVVWDEDGKVNTGRYEAVNAMLLKEFLKEHRNVQKFKNWRQRSLSRKGSSSRPSRSNKRTLSLVPRNSRRRLTTSPQASKSRHRKSRK